MKRIEDIQIQLQFYLTYIKRTEQIHTAGVKIVRRRLFNYQQNHFISDEVKTRGKVRISGNVGILTDSF